MFRMVKYCPDFVQKPPRSFSQRWLILYQLIPIATDMDTSLPDINDEAILVRGLNIYDFRRAGIVFQFITV